MFSKIPEQFRGFIRPQLGQFVIWVLIYIAITKTYSTLPIFFGERVSPVTVLSFLPESILTSSLVFKVCRDALLVAGILWTFQLLLPLSCWITVLSFTAIVALFYENASHIAHVFNLANIVLIIHAMWYQFYHREIKESLARGRFWRTHIYPKWVVFLSVFCIAIYHTYAGVSKLAESGLQWANGVSLQLWLHLWGLEDSFLSELLVSNRSIAIATQAITLLFETGAILAILSRKFRIAVGLALLGLYFGVLESFGYRFEYNALLVAVFFLPLDTALNHLYERAHNTIKITINLACGKWARKICRFVLSRLDIFGLIEVCYGSTTNATEDKLTNR